MFHVSPPSISLSGTIFPPVQKIKQFNLIDTKHRMALAVGMKLCIMWNSPINWVKLPCTYVLHVVGACCPVCRTIIQHIFKCASLAAPRCSGPKLRAACSCSYCWHLLSSKWKFSVHVPAARNRNRALVSVAVAVAVPVAQLHAPPSLRHPHEICLCQLSLCKSCCCATASHRKLNQNFYEPQLVQQLKMIRI